jgi:hypothetical protein
MPTNGFLGASANADAAVTRVRSVAVMNDPGLCIGTIMRGASHGFPDASGRVLSLKEALEAADERVKGDSRLDCMFR